MNDLDALAFGSLFKDAYKKCFGYVLKDPLTETESKLFSNKIFEQTGLVIGPKSIKNYSIYVLNPNANDENPSIATLDTLARYVLDAPYTDEIQRKNKEAHYPYWFTYKNEFYQSQKPARKKGFAFIMPISAIVIITALVVFLFFSNEHTGQTFVDDFHSVAEDSLVGRGWIIQSKDEAYWKRRDERPGCLTLFTLKGDNWPDSADKPDIKNLLLRKVSSDCFTAEAHLSEFFPAQNWQQAGILLMEDTTFSSKSVRLSLVYNDFYGGFPKSREIIIQVITSKGKYFDKPEELAHQLVFRLDSASENLVKENLQHSALRIERNGEKIRLLFANGSMTNSAFKEILNREIDINPRFIGLFALRGFVDSTSAMPARFDFFSFNSERCE